VSNQEFSAVDIIPPWFSLLNHSGMNNRLVGGRGHLKDMNNNNDDTHKHAMYRRVTVFYVCFRGDGNYDQISGFHGGETADVGTFGCNAICSCRYTSPFRRSILPPSSVLKMKVVFY
jgi:hypothetical protein